MRFYLLLFGALCAAVVGFAQVSHAAETYAAPPSETVAQAIEITPELVEAHHAYQLAQLRLQQYRFVELPRQRRLLDDQIRQLVAEIRVLRRRARDYRPFLQVGRYSPVRTAAEHDQLALQGTEQLLRRLREDRIQLMRFSRQTSQLYQLDVLRTATRVRQVMAAAPVVTQ